MTENIYAPPHSNVEVASVQHRFYVVAPRKFWVLFLITLGLYSTFWFYQNWKLFKANGDPGIWPVPRAIFAIFFTHSLFRFVQARIDERNISYEWRYRTVATSWVVLSIFNNSLTRLSFQSPGSPIADILSLAMVPVLGWTLYRAQLAINAAEGDPTGSENKRFTMANVLWIVLLTLLWALAVIGLFLPPK